jgi:toxin ParE1/3/4
MNNKYNIYYLPATEKDLREIIEYIRIDSPTYVIKSLEQVDEAISRLEEFPFMGVKPKDNRLQYLSYRMLIIGNYLVFYVIKDNTIEIRRILHGKRKYNFLL